MTSQIKFQAFALVFFFSFLYSVPAQNITGTLRIRGIILDKSSNRQVVASDISLMAFENLENAQAAGKGDGMQVLASLPSGQNRFDFAVPARESGYLLSVNYDSENYIRIIPYKEALNGKPIEMAVYSMGADPSSILITTMQLVKKLEKSLLVERAYVISNKSTPPKTYSGKKLKFLLPEGSKNLHVTMQLEETGMTVPVGTKLSEDGGGFYIDRSFPKGATTLTVNFEYPSHQLPDRMPDVISDDGKSPKSHNFRVLSWKPTDAKPVIESGETEDLDIPNIGAVLKVSYPTEKEVILDFRKGSVFFEKGSASAENPFYTSPLRNLLGIIIFTAFLFLIMHLYIIKTGQKG
jgi:hypothetical protein